jgi:hypothetical protein
MTLVETVSRTFPFGVWIVTVCRFGYCTRFFRGALNFQGPE